jgi:hypothetical protein
MQQLTWRTTLDIAPFAYRDDDPAERTLVFRWEEPRDIYRIILDLANETGVPQSGKLKVSYWRRVWPEHRITAADLRKGVIGSVGWKPRDDWFNGAWTPADATIRAKGSQVTISFRPLARREFPDLADFNVRFRQTVKLRVDLSEGCPDVKGVRILTDTPVRERSIVIETGCGRPNRPHWDGRVEVYNGSLEGLTPPDSSDPRLCLKVMCAQPGPLSYDRTVVTLRSSTFNLSFRPDDLDQGPIWIPDFGVLVTDAAMNVRYSPELIASLRTAVSTYDAVAAEPEQSLRRAKREQPPKEPMHFIVGCEGGRQKFGLAPNGDLFAHVGFVRSVAGADTPRVGWQGGAFALRFGWDNWLRASRRIAHGCVPVYEATFCRGALDVRLEAFAAPVAQSILAGPIAGDAAVACLLRLTFINNGDTSIPVAQPLRFFTYTSGPGAVSRNLAEPLLPETLQIRDDLIVAAGSPEYLRMAVDTGGRGEFSATADGLAYCLELAPGASHSIVLKVPFLGMLSDEEIGRLRAKDFDAERAEAIRFWESRLSAAGAIITPEPDITDFYRSHLTHILINDDREVNSDRLMGRVSSFSYGNFSNEAIMQIMELDRRGLHDEARRHLETYLHYQGTVSLPGNFKTKDGVFYGSGGYEHGGYNQHHGWVLWGLAEHYCFTGDRAWLIGIANGLIAGCDWVIRERKATMRSDANGKRVLEYGFLPAGSLEDVTDFYYWLSTNALTSRGLTAAAEALAEAGHPQGERLVREAKAYRDDLLAGFHESMIRSPVVRLRDGTYIPHHPSRLYWRGRDFGWIREVLEGSINLCTTVLDPRSEEATWALKDYEDNRYLDAPYNYPLDNFEAHWFSRGGFSMQPNLLYFTPPYLYRDQVEHFLRAFFNGFVACWRADIRAMTEHPLPTLSDWAGDHFKSSDEAMVAMWLRMMFIHEEGDALYLGRGLPRAWLGDGGGVAIRNAATYFGRMSLEMSPAEGGRCIVAEIDPPLRRPPARTVLRFRHPHKARIAQVVVNGEPTDTFDADKEWIILPALREPTVVEARFEPEAPAAG